MNISFNDILRLVLIAIKEKESLQELETAIEEQTDCQNEIVSEIIEIANEAIREIAIKYIPCVQYEDIVVENKTFNLSNLSKSYFALRSIRREETNRQIKFKIENGNLICANGALRIGYLYLPQNFKMNDTINDFCTSVTIDLIKLMVLIEWYKRKGNEKESEMLSAKFSGVISSAVRRYDEVRVRRREWV